MLRVCLILSLSFLVLDKLVPRVMLVELFGLFRAVAVRCDHCSAIKLQKVTLIVIEHSPLQDLTLVLVMDKSDDVQIFTKLPLALMEYLGLFYGFMCVLFIAFGLALATAYLPDQKLGQVAPLIVKPFPVENKLIEQVKLLLRRLS